MDKLTHIKILEEKLQNLAPKYATVCEKQRLISNQIAKIKLRIKILKKDIAQEQIEKFQGQNRR